MKAACLSGVAKTIAVIIASFMLNQSYAKENQPAKKNDKVHVKKSGNSSEIAVLTRYEVKKGFEKKFRKAIRKYVKRANAKESNIMAEGYYEEGNNSILWTIERWNGQNSLAQFRKRAKFKRIKSLSKQKLAGSPKEIYVKDLEPISKNEWRRSANKEDEPITIMLFVDSKPGTEESFKTTYHTAMPLFRSEPGVINYQLSQLLDDSTQFVTYEKFRNEDAFQYHLKFPPIQPVIDYLNTSIKQQPFQIGLHRLIGFAPAKK
jgi:quinol monooxygenase YgiN